MFQEIKEQIKAIDERRYKDIKPSSQTLKYMQYVFNQSNEIDKELLQTYIKLFIIDNDDLNFGNDDTYTADDGDEIKYGGIKLSDIENNDEQNNNMFNNIIIKNSKKQTIAIISVCDDGNTEYCKTIPFNKSRIPHFYLNNTNKNLQNKELLNTLQYIDSFKYSELLNIFINDDVAELSKYVAIKDHKTAVYTTNAIGFVPLIGLAEMYGAIKCFKFLYLNDYFDASLINQKCIVIGNNYEIFHICENEGINFLTMLKYSIQYHRNELIEYCYMKCNITEYDFIKLIMKCLTYYNYEALEFLLEHETYRPKIPFINNYSVLLNNFSAIEYMITKYNYIMLNNFNGIIYETILNGYEEDIIKFIFNNNLPLDDFNYKYMIMKEAIRQNKNIELFKLLLQGLFGVSNLWNNYDIYVLIDPLTTFVRNSYKLETFDINILKLLIAEKSINNFNIRTGENILFNLIEAYYITKHHNIIELIKYLADIGFDYIIMNNKGENILNYYLNKHYTDVSDTDEFVQLCKSLGLQE